MLQPDEDPYEKALFYKCKICDYQERAEDGNEAEHCVYKTDVEGKATKLIVNRDIVDDPTLQKRIIQECRTQGCKGTEVVCYYQIKGKFELIYMCTTCREQWKMDQKDETYDIDS